MKKKLLMLCITMISVAMIAGCGSKEEVVTETETATEEPVEVEIVTEEAEPEVVGPAENRKPLTDNENLLTGIFDLTDEAVGKRPVAVMVNNVAYALPQYGIAAADVIFEIPVEGNYTRFMALYGDYTQIPQICSVRSCRPFFPAIAAGFDAYYTYWGMSGEYESYVAGLDIDTFNGIVNYGNMFGRDTERQSEGYALEHTSYFDGTMVPEVVEEKGLRSDLYPIKEGSAFIFNGVDESVVPDGDACTEVTIEFGAVTAGFNYDETTNTYFKTYNGEPQIDGREETQLEFTNVIVLETEITTINEVGSKDVYWEGGKTDHYGYYVSNGTVQKITWDKANNAEASYLRFYDEAGEELPINRGKSYIAMNFKNQATFE